METTMFDEKTLPPIQPSVLYLVATPIGNLEDITLRALRVLKECDLILAEDTRHSGILLHHYGIKKELMSYFKFNEARRTEQIINLLHEGKKIAMITDAGSPGISDPGQRLVQAAITAGFKVESVPGPCALIAALSASGLPTDEFHFIGFLPKKPSKRKNTLSHLLGIQGTIVIYESPYRVVALLTELCELAPHRFIVLAREITKKFEEYLRGKPNELLEKLKNRTLKGEFVILIGPDTSSAGEAPGD
jgi:16S rRNA (cytidine1402-2'-O)-methyltransferase